MSVDRHPIFVGHFIHDQKFVECDIDAETRIAYPRVRMPLTGEELDQSSKGRISPDDRDGILRTGYFFVELTDCTHTELEVVRELMNRYSCDLVDRCFRVVPLAELPRILNGW